MRLSISLTTLCAFLLTTTGALAQADDNFYRGKTIELVIGGSPGVSYDLIGRALAQHMPDHMAAHPTFIVENMPGAGSLTMTNFLYNRARRDGTVIGMPNTNIIFEPTLKLMSRDGGAVQFDLEKFIWLGTPVQEPQIAMVWKGAPATTLAEMKTQKILFGSSAVGSDNNTLPQMMNRIWGTQNQIVLGYKSPNDIFLAMERGEVQGVSAALSTLMANRSDWVRDHKVSFLMQFGFNRVAELPDVPTAIEQAPDAESAEMLRFIAAKFALARPFVLPPDTPPARVAVLKQAYDETMRDPGFIADVARLGVSVQPIDAATTTRMIHDIQTTPADRVARLRAVINP